MRILHLLQSSHFSGAENVVCQIFEMMKDEPNIQMAYCSRDGQIREALKERGIKFYPLKKFSISEVKKIIKEYQPDIIHAHDISASICAAFSTLGKKCKVISHVHVNNSDMAKINVKTIFYSISTICYEHIFWVSQSCFDGFILKKVIQRKSSVLYNVLDKGLILNRKNKDKNIYCYDIAYVGRLTEQKDPMRLIDVLEKVIELCPECQIAIVGEGNLEEDVREKVKKEKLEKNISFTGFMSNPLRLIECSKVMIMTSKYEGLPMTVLEAMALGVPLVSTPVDGLKDIIEDGVNGYLEDDNDNLSQRLNEIISNSELQSRLSKESRRKFDEINNVENYKIKIKQIYEE